MPGSSGFRPPGGPLSLHPAITVSRTLGSGGTLVAYRVAQRLGWRYCDRSILRKTAEAFGVEARDLDPREERPDRFLDRLLRLLPAASPEVPFAPPPDLPLYGRDLYEQERRVMEDLLEGAPAVLVGRGGFVAFRHRPATLHVHIQADPAFRIRRLQEIGLAGTEEAARLLLQASDRDREAFIRQISGRAWSDPRNFHLVLDASRLGFDACEAEVLAAAERNLGVAPQPARA